MRASEKKGKTKAKDKDSLTPRLNDLIAQNYPNAEIFSDTAWEKSVPTASSDMNDTQSIQLDDIPALSLQKFISVETSYSQISRELKAKASNDNNLRELITDDDGEDVIRNDEHHVEDFFINIDTDADIDTNTDINKDVGINFNNGINTSPLIGGKTTGDALHKAIEELMLSDDVNKIINDTNGALDNIVEKYLKRGGILDNPSTTDPTAAVKQASSYIKTALTLP